MVNNACRPKPAEPSPRRRNPFQSLGSQNDKLKSNYEAVRTELVQLREKHNTTRKQLLEAVESRVSADQRTETLVHKWKVQLEARTKELESLQAKLVPQDLDMLRAKVQEELEVPQQRRVALLEAEVEKHRQMFCKARRDHERCKVRYIGHEASQFGGAHVGPKRLCVRVAYSTSNKKCDDLAERLGIMTGLTFPCRGCRHLKTFVVKLFLLVFLCECLACSCTHGRREGVSLSIFRRSPIDRNMHNICMRVKPV